MVSKIEIKILPDDVNTLHGAWYKFIVTALDENDEVIFPIKLETTKTDALGAAKILLSDTPERKHETSSTEWLSKTEQEYLKGFNTTPPTK